MEYNVCVKREYLNRAGQKRIHWWQVGKAFTSTTQDGKEVVNIKLWSRTLMVDELVGFEHGNADKIAEAVKDRPNQQDHDDDDIPF